MMKFSRSYDRSVLIYRESGPSGRILLRLGRVFEDGECKPDNAKSIPDGFNLLTYIVAKDPEALIQDIAERFSEFLDGDTDLAFSSIIFDTLKLQEHISKEQSLPGGSDLIRSLDLLYGKQVMEILFAATFGDDGRKHGRQIKASQKINHDRELPVAAIGISGFVAIIVVPLVAVAIFRPDLYEAVHSAVTGQSVIINYASKAEAPLASWQPPLQEEENDIFAQANQRKQEFYLIAGLGVLTEDHEYTRSFTSEVEGDIVTLEAAGDDSQHLTPPDAPQVDTQDDDTDLTPVDQDASPLDQQETSFTEVLDVALASKLADKTLAEPEVLTTHGVPSEIAKFSIKSFTTFDAGDPIAGTKAEGVNASYDVARRPATIFEVVRGDLAGIGRSMDDAIEAVCNTVNETQSDELPLVNASFSFDLGSSPFMATVVDVESCKAGEYTIFPMFELDLSVE